MLYLIKAMALWLLSVFLSISTLLLSVTTRIVEEWLGIFYFVLIHFWQAICSVHQLENAKHECPLQHSLCICQFLSAGKKITSFCKSQQCRQWEPRINVLIFPSKLCHVAHLSQTGQHICIPLPSWFIGGYSELEILGRPLFHVQRIIKMQRLSQYGCRRSGCFCVLPVHSHESICLACCEMAAFQYLNYEEKSATWKHLYEYISPVFCDMGRVQLRVSGRQGENRCNETSCSKACAPPRVQQTFMLSGSRTTAWLPNNLWGSHTSVKGLFVFWKNCKYYLDFQFNFPQSLYLFGEICLPSCSALVWAWREVKQKEITEVLGSRDCMSRRISTIQTISKMTINSMPLLSGLHNNLLFHKMVIPLCW